MNSKELKNFSINLAKQSGKILMKYFGNVKFVKTKEGHSYYTNADLESEKLILSAIKKKYPSHDIISEESGRLNKKSDYTWFIDPLDGTHNFINGLPMFGVSIALAHKGKSILGVIYLPFYNEMYVAEKGKGCYLDGKKIKVLKKSKLKNSFVLTELILRHLPGKKLKLLNKIKDIVYDIWVLGSAAFAQAMVAKGSADVYSVKGTHSWDIAAGLLMIEEAGGKASMLNGNPWKIKDGAFLAANKTLHPKLLKIIN
jgi:myo-inositol-1(or 4)-monophosphatase|tara:strand:- start:407 stop:1174 length:768 start_codon:yes stop_codon:yes gene_type:complete